MAGDTVCDLGLEALDILEHAADAPLQVTAPEGALSRGALVLQGRQLGHDAEAGPHEFLQGLKGLGCRARCHLPVASKTTRSTLKRFSSRLSWRIPAAVLGMRHETSFGNTWISSQFLLTSIPTLESVLVVCSGISLPCIRDIFPIICSGRRPRGRWTSLPHSPGDSGINGPIHPQPDRRPQARSHLSSSVNETVQAIYKDGATSQRTGTIMTREAL